MKQLTPKPRLHSVQVSGRTHARLRFLRDQSGITIMRLIDQAVSALPIARRKYRKQSD